MKYYRLDQRRKQWSNVATNVSLEPLVLAYQAMDTANGKRIMKSDGTIIIQKLPATYRTLKMA